MAPPPLISDLADLVLGRCCLGCGAPAPGVCRACLERQRGRARTVTRPGIDPPLFAATEYAGLARSMVLAYKEEGYRSLARPLGWLLADAVWAALSADGLRPAAQAPCTLVAVPGHRRPRRGFDAVGALVREAHDALSGRGLPVVRRRLLESASDYPALKGLGRTGRHAHVTGAFRTAGSDAAPGCVVLVDDVVTTGATLAEAATTLEASGIRVSAVAVIAATPRSHA